LQTVGNEPDLKLNRDFGFIPVSPWEIECVERVARCLRWALTGRTLLNFPAKLKARMPSSVDAAKLPRWVSGDANGNVTILRHPRQGELTGLDIDDLVESSKFAIETIEEAEGRVLAQLGRAAHHERKALRHEVTKLQRELMEKRKLHDSLNEFDREIRSILQFADVSVCPICKTPADPASGPRQQSRFYEYRCTDCHAAWGVRICKVCHKRTAFLFPGSLTLPDYRSPGWVDQLFGSDVLAIPRGSNVFECCHCGKDV
jgi:hypothetical protein